MKTRGFAMNAQACKEKIVSKTKITAAHACYSDLMEKYENPILTYREGKSGSLMVGRNFATVTGSVFPPL